MPQAIVAAGAWIATVGSSTAALFGLTTGFGASFAIGVGVVTAGAIAANKLMASLYEIPSLDVDKQRTVRGTVEPQKIVYGTALVSGPVSFLGATGIKNRDLYHSVVLAGHEVNGISDIHFDNEVITNVQMDGSGNVTVGRFGPVNGNTVVKVNKHLGQSGQAADADLVAAFTSYTSSHKGTGLAYIVTKWTLWDDTQELWDKYMPSNIMAVVEGKKVYNNLTDTTAFSDNPVWCLIDYMRDTTHGMGIETASIDFDAADVAAAICDATVAVPGGTEKRYTANGVLLATDSHKTNINKLLSAMNGMLSYTNGVFVIRAGAYEAPTVSLNESHLQGAVSVKTALERSDRFNTVTGTFVDPSSRYKAMEFPQVQLSSALTRDNNEVLKKEIQLSLTNSSYMAQRLGYKLCLQSFLQQVITFPTNLAGIQVAVGSRVNVTLSDFGWTDKIFLCIGWTFSDSGDGGVNLILREDASTAYADPAVGDYDQTTITERDLSVSRGVTAPTALAAFGSQGSIEVTWSNPANMSNVLTIEVWASPTSNAAQIQKIGETVSTQFIHDASNPVDPIFGEVTRYYWVRSRAYSAGDSSAAISDFYPNNLVSTISATSQTPSISITASPSNLGWVSIDNGSTYSPSALTQTSSIKFSGATSVTETLTVTRVSNAISGTVTITGTAFTLSQAPTGNVSSKTITVTHTSSGETVNVTASVEVFNL